MAKELVKVELKNPALIEKTEKIRQYEGGVRANLYGIANILHDVDKSQLYKEDGFKNVVDYAEKVFNYKKSMIYNMLQVAENYLISGENKTVFSQGNKDFSMGQVQELLALPPAKSKELVKKGEVTSDMTTKQIREVVKANKPKKETSPKVKAKQMIKERGKKEEKLEKAKEETAANNNKHVKNIRKIFGELETQVNSLKVQSTEKDKLLLIFTLMEELKQEIGLE